MWWRSVSRAQSARRFLSYVIVAASVFAAAPGRAQDTIAQVKALKETLHGLKPDGPQPEDKLSRVQLTQLATTISRILDPTIAATAWAEELAARLDWPDDRKFTDSETAQLNWALTGLIEAIKSDGTGGPKPAAPPAAAAPAAPAPGAPAAAAPAPAPAALPADAQLRTMNETLTKLRPTEGEPKERLEPGELKQLAAAISVRLDPVVAATNWAKDLTFILKERNPARTDGGLRKALAALPKNITPPPAVLSPPRLNIIQAWFGDFRYVRLAARGQLRIDPETGTGHRVCDATNEVRSACQGRMNCPFDLDGGNKPAGAKLCGEHPVRHGSGDVVGIAMEFQCLEQTQKEWDEMQNTWRIKTSGPDPQMVMLRATTPVTIRCKAETGEDGDEADKVNVGSGATKPGQKQ